jgi:hypothetical protein
MEMKRAISILTASLLVLAGSSATAFAQAENSAADHAPGHTKADGESAKSSAPGQVKGDDESAQAYAPGHLKNAVDEGNDGIDNDGDGEIDEEDEG